VSGQEGWLQMGYDGIEMDIMGFCRYCDVLGAVAKIFLGAGGVGYMVQERGFWTRGLATLCRYLKSF
jgi:hypothetical protein